MFKYSIFLLFLIVLAQTAQAQFQDYKNLLGQLSLNGSSYPCSDTLDCGAFKRQTFVLDLDINHDSLWNKLGHELYEYPKEQILKVNTVRFKGLKYESLLLSINNAYPRIKLFENPIKQIFEERNAMNLLKTAQFLDNFAYTTQPYSYSTNLFFLPDADGKITEQKLSAREVAELRQTSSDSVHDMVDLVILAYAMLEYQPHNDFLRQHNLADLERNLGRRMRIVIKKNNEYYTYNNKLCFNVFSDGDYETHSPLQHQFNQLNTSAKTTYSMTELNRWRKHKTHSTKTDRKLDNKWFLEQEKNNIFYYFNSGYLSQQKASSFPEYTLSHLIYAPKRGCFVGFSFSSVTPIVKDIEFRAISVNGQPIIENFQTSTQTLPSNR